MARWFSARLSRRVLWGVFGGLGLVVALLGLELFTRLLVYHGLFVTDPTYQTNATLTLTRQIKHRQPLVLMLGDSKLRQAIAPTLLQYRLNSAHSDIHVVNAALSPTSWPLTYYTLNMLYQQGIHPTLIILGVSTQTTSSINPASADVQRSIAAEYGLNCTTLPSKWLQWSCQLNHHVMIWHYRYTLLNSLDMLARLWGEPLASKRTLWQVTESGWQPSIAIGQHQPQTVGKTNPLNTQAILPLLSLAQAHHTPVVLVGLPGSHVSTQALVRLAQPYPHVQCINYAHHTYPIEYWSDLTSLNVVGSVAFTEQFSQWLLQHHAFKHAGSL